MHLCLVVSACPCEAPFHLELKQRCCFSFEQAAALAKLLSQSTDYGSGSSMRHYSGGSDWSMGAVDDTLDDGGGTSSPMARTATTTPSTDVGSLRIGSLLRTSTLSSSRFLVCRICEHKVRVSTCDPVHSSFFPGSIFVPGRVSSVFGPIQTLQHKIIFPDPAWH